MQITSPKYRQLVRCIFVIEDVQGPVVNCRPPKMRVMEGSSEIGVEHDWWNASHLLFRPAQSPGCLQPSICGSPKSRLGEPPGVEQQPRINFSEHLAGDGASSSTAFSKWASLSFRLLEPPCVPSRRSAKWLIKVVIYAGVALFGTFYLPLKNRSVLHTLNVGRHSGRGSAISPHQMLSRTVRGLSRAMRAISSFRMNVTPGWDCA